MIHEEWLVQNAGRLTQREAEAVRSFAAGWVVSQVDQEGRVITFKEAEPPVTLSCRVACDVIDTGMRVSWCKRCDAKHEWRRDAEGYLGWAKIPEAIPDDYYITWRRVQ